MKLKQIKTDTFTFRKTLPKALNGLGPDDCKEVFIEIEGRYGAAMNPKYLADAEAIAKKAIVMDEKRKIIERKAKKNEAAAERLVKTSITNNEAIGVDQICITYDNCVTSWSTNICDEDDEVLEATRENFIGLSQMKVKAIADVIMAFMKELDAVSEIIEKADEADLKNSQAHS